MFILRVDGEVWRIAQGGLGLNFDIYVGKFVTCVGVSGLSA